MTKPAEATNGELAMYLPQGIPRCLVIAIIAATIGLSAGCEPGPAINIEAERAGMQQRQEAFLEALSQRNAGEASAYFAEDAIVHIANMPPVQGRDAIHRLYENVFQYLGAAEYAPELLRLSGGADMAYSAGSVTTIFETDREQMEFPGKYLLIWEKADDVWSIAFYGISNNGSAP